MSGCWVPGRDEVSGESRPADDGRGERENEREGAGAMESKGVVDFGCMGRMESSTSDFDWAKITQILVYVEGAIAIAGLVVFVGGPRRSGGRGVAGGPRRIDILFGLVHGLVRVGMILQQVPVFPLGTIQGLGILRGTILDFTVPFYQQYSARMTEMSSGTSKLNSMVYYS